jgi:hypothetical protein
VRQEWKIEHYRSIATRITDEGLKALIEACLAERAALHPDQNQQRLHWHLGLCAGVEKTVMRNTIDIDSRHSREIVRAIGERLRASFEEERELPASFKAQIQRLRQLEDEAQPRG